MLKNLFRKRFKIQVINATGKDRFPMIHTKTGDTIHINDDSGTTFMKMKIIKHNKLKITIIPDSIRIKDKK